MPPRMRKARRKRKAPVGPFDLRTRKLPGGTEMEALATGFALERERGIGYGAGYTMAAALANRNTLLDATNQQPWVLAESETGLMRSLNAPQLFTEYQDEMEEIFTDKALKGKNITADKFSRGDAWKRVLGLEKNTSLTGPLEDVGKHYVKLKDGVFLHHRMTTYAMPPLVVHPQHRITY